MFTRIFQNHFVSFECSFYMRIWTTSKMIKMTSFWPRFTFLDGQGLTTLFEKSFFKTFRLGLDKIMIIINRCNCKTYVILLWEIIFCRLNNDFNHRVLDFNLLITAVNESKWHICLETSDFSNQKRPITNQKISWNSKSLMNHM